MSTKRIKTFCMAVTFIAVFSFVSITFAQQAGSGAAGGAGGSTDIIGGWDKDKDGKVSKAEWPRSEKLFKELDKNSNGYIDSDEKPSMPTTGLMDANGDNKISKDEFLGPADFFKQLDKNSDGFLTDDENTMSGSGGGAPAGGAPGAGGTPKQ